MESWEWIVVGAAAAAALVLVVALVRIRRRRAHLKEQFGPEYDRVIADAGTGGGERRLSEIESERSELDLHPLSRAARDRFLEEWRQAESRFVSDPREAASVGKRLVERVLEERGYPNDDDKLVTFISVDHPDVAERYRHAYAMLDTDQESTENLRKAMLDFRAVLENVIQDPEPARR